MGFLQLDRGREQLEDEVQQDETLVHQVDVTISMA